MMNKKILGVLLLVFALGYSCQNDFIETNKLTENGNSTRSLAGGLSADWAKRYFELNYHNLELPSFRSEARNGICKDANCPVHVHDHAPNNTTNQNSLPDLKKSNIILEWDKSAIWSDDRASYVEVPMNVGGGQLFALKKWNKINETMKHERTKVTCSLLIQKAIGSDSVSCNVVTLIGDKSYLREMKKRRKDVRFNILKDGFSGYFVSSTLSGNIRKIYRYENGQIVRILRRGREAQQKTLKGNLDIVSLSLFDMGANASAYTLSWEICDFCGYEHDWWEECPPNLWQCEGCGTLDPETCTCFCPRCGFKECVCYPICTTCGYIIEGCICCKACGGIPAYSCRSCGNCEKHCPCCKICWNDPCECNLCKTCYKDPCECKQ